LLAFFPLLGGPPSTCFPHKNLDMRVTNELSCPLQSFAFAFYMDRAKEERERGVTIACTTKEFFTVWSNSLEEA
jgi:hypothetical protein